MPVPKNNFTQAGFRQIQVQGSKQSTPKPLASSNQHNHWTADGCAEGPSAGSGVTAG